MPDHVDANVKSIAARKAISVRHYGAGDPRVAALDNELRVEKIAAAIKRTVAAAPPLTPAQRDRLRALLDGGTPDEAPAS